MSAREETTMGDILATEANLLGMIKEVNSNFKMLPLKIAFKKDSNWAVSAQVKHLSCLVFVLVP